MEREEYCMTGNFLMDVILYGFAHRPLCPKIYSVLKNFQTPGMHF